MKKNLISLFSCLSLLVVAAFVSEPSPEKSSVVCWALISPLIAVSILSIAYWLILLYRWAARRHGDSAVFFSLVVFCLIATPARAQIGVSQRVYIQGTTVVVASDIDKVARVLVNGVPAGGVTPGADPWRHRFGGGAWPFYSLDYREVAISVQVCERVGEQSFTYPPPTWATDGSFLRPLGATPLPYSLPATVSETDLKSFVEEIKNALDGHRITGRGDMKKELDQWFKLVKKHGVRTTETLCEGPTTQSVRVNISSYNGYGGGARTEVIHLRGPDWNRGGYYLAVQ